MERAILRILRKADSPMSWENGIYIRLYHYYGNLNGPGHCYVRWFDVLNNLVSKGIVKIIGDDCYKLNNDLFFECKIVE